MKKEMSHYLLTSLLLLIISSCSTTHNTEQFGQKPPGKTPELFMPGIISTGAHDMSLAISNDQKKIYLRRSNLNWSSTIILFEKGKKGWKKPKIAGFAKSLDNSYPFLSYDNSRFYFNSTRSLSEDKTEKPVMRIWSCKSINNNWSEPEVLKIEANPDVNMISPTISKNGNIYFYSSNLTGLGKSDIYCIRKTADGYKEPENLGQNINSEHWEFHPYISPDEDFLIFDAVRPEGFSSNDLYISFKQPDGSWTRAVNMGETINSKNSEMRPYLSPDGKYLFFCSDRQISHAESYSQELNYSNFSKIVNGPGNGSQDIYWMDANIIEEIKQEQLK